jgi:hypothetical protein
MALDAWSQHFVHINRNNWEKKGKSIWRIHGMWVTPVLAHAEQVGWHPIAGNIGEYIKEWVSG